MADLNAQINEARQHGYSDEDILSYLGNSRADLAPKIKEAQSHGYAPSDIVGYLGNNPPSQPSPLSKAAGAFWEGIGGKAALDILGGASRDPARAQKAAETVKALTAGIAAEPGRIWSELSNTGQSILKGDLSGTAYHLAGSVPIFGAPAQQVANEVQQGKYAEAAGHTASLFAPFAAKPAAAAIAPVAERAAATVADVATGPTATALRGGLVEAAKESAKKPPVGATLMGEMIGGHKGAAAAAVIAKAPSVVRAFRTGAQQALLDRSLASAQEILGTSLDEFAQSVADKPYAKLDAATQAKVVDFYQKAAAARQAYVTKTQPAPAAAPSVMPERAPEPAPAELIPESRRLPAGPPLFEMPPATDSSYVRAVPAEYPEVIRQPVVTPEPAPATTPALQLRDAIEQMAQRKVAESAPPAPATMPPETATMAPAEAEAVFQQQKARIQEGMTPPPEQPPPAPATVGNVQSAIDEINSKFPANPANANERVLMIDGKPAATFEVAERDGRLRLKTMQSETQQSGVGSLLLNRLIRTADKHGATIELTASPFGETAGRISGEKLKDWYGRHGFADEPGYDPALGYMVRSPKTPPPKFPPSGAPAVAGGPSLLPLPEDVPPHYQALQQLEGTSAATRTFLKDRRIADYLLNKGVTPEQWEAMPLEDQNRLITQAPSASARGKHRPFVPKPEGAAPRAFGRWAEEGVKDIADTMRWMQEQAKITAATQR